MKPDDRPDPLAPPPPRAAPPGRGENRDGRCRCTATLCASCEPCAEPADAEDLLCAYCRIITRRAFPCCHRHPVGALRAQIVGQLGDALGGEPAPWHQPPGPLVIADRIELLGGCGSRTVGEDVVAALAELGDGELLAALGYATGCRRPFGLTEFGMGER